MATATKDKTITVISPGPDKPDLKAPTRLNDNPLVEIQKQRQVGRLQDSDPTDLELPVLHLFQDAGISPQDIEADRLAFTPSGSATGAQVGFG